MIVSITDDDIALAKQRSPQARNHAWHNPLAIALARMMGEPHMVTITERFIHVNGDKYENVGGNLILRQQSGLNSRIPLDAETGAYMRSWLADRAKPAVISVIWL